MNGDLDYNMLLDFKIVSNAISLLLINYYARVQKNVINLQRPPLM